MELSGFDLTVFIGFIVFVIGVSLYASRKEETSEDYFLAGRNLKWYLIGFSLIASNISTEHFVGIAAIIKPVREPKKLPVNKDIDLRSSPTIKIWGALIVAATIVLYIIFR